MCDRCDDFNRTVVMLGDLCLYSERPGVDEEFADVVGGALALSLPADGITPGYGPADEPGREA
ncbi:hypothetical protein [Streptomyces fractus]|uniref:hypothetical protein n=1 Tax=Streptomyces fractus TaxID=641806 RepID=UPI003CEBAA04